MRVSKEWKITEIRRLVTGSRGLLCHTAYTSTIPGCNAKVSKAFYAAKISTLYRTTQDELPHTHAGHSRCICFMQAKLHQAFSNRLTSACMASLISLVPALPPKSPVLTSKPPSALLSSTFLTASSIISAS